MSGVNTQDSVVCDHPNGFMDWDEQNKTYCCEICGYGALNDLNK